jgi:chromosome segregation ATPase
MTDKPQQPAPDPLAARLQAHLEHFEARPELAEKPVHRHRLDDAGPHPDAHNSVAAIADLNAQLDLLRQQLDAAFDDVDARIEATNQRAEAAATRAKAAEVRAVAAESRAQVASARAADVLTAVDELAAELTRLAETVTSEDLSGVRAAVDRVRARLHAS